ncbi:MAG: diaminobutyrate--2-oxoglutarate transaminase, partial [Planctomycetales bacterium]|nr:diaminobutyrate--2-oxoglutarate transaminase [Planctomycetales bacterium]
MVSDIFARLESEVRSYCRVFPTVFTRAKGHTMVDEDGKSFIDFFAGAGALNYGHNPPELVEALIRYLRDGGIAHSLDMSTTAKRRFLERFEELVLRPRGMNYKVMFPGPTGTNSVEAALKIARLVTGRPNVIAFTNAFHGMTLGSLALTGNSSKREGAGVTLTDVTRMPFHRCLDDQLDTIDLLEHHLSNSSSGVDLPAAVVLETIQAEGGVNVASVTWLRRLQQLVRRFKILLIVDDIQVGCGRTGEFFSFEKAGLEPDIICLSKSLSGFGQPFAVTLMKPEWDQWDPGKHNGTFRGNNLAFVTAAAALEHYWSDDTLTRNVHRLAERVHQRLTAIGKEHGLAVRGRGLIQGIEVADGETADQISAHCFRNGLIIETAGARGEVVKILPPLTITESALDEGLDTLQEAVNATLDS